MPTKHNLNKYDRLRDSIRKVAQKDESLYSKDDLLIKNMATLIAVFSPSYSWKTHRELSSEAPRFDLPEIKSEFLEAQKTKWKSINSYDILDVSKKNMHPSRFDRWLYYNVDSNMRMQYRKAWDYLQALMDKDDEIIQELQE